MRPVEPPDFDPLVVSDANFAYYNAFRAHQGLKPVARDAYKATVLREIARRERKARDPRSIDEMFPDDVD